MSPMKIYGGVSPHVVRRLIHVLMISGTPLLYYLWLVPISPTPMFPKHVVIFSLIIILLFEMLRLYKGWEIYGQRHYETHCISAFAWTSISLSILFLCSTSMLLTIAIAVSCGIADPILGELRSLKYNEWVSMLIAAMIIFFIWYFFSFTWWISVIMGIVTVAVEKPRLKWIDDNALMLLVPFVLFYLLKLI